MVWNEALRQALILMLLGWLFIIPGVYFGLVRKRVGLRHFAPLQGATAEVWGWLMCAVGAMLVLLAFL